MPQQISKQSQTAMWLQTLGPFNPAAPFQRGQAGVGDITLPGPGDRTVFFGTNAFGLPVPLGFERSAPGQPSTTLENYATLFRDEVQKMRDLGQTRFVQIRMTNCGDMDHPALYSWVIHLGRGQTGDATLSAPVAREFGDARIEQAHPFVPLYHITWYAQSLTRQTTAEVGAANGVVFLSDPSEDCGNGYVGPDKIGYIACDADTGVTAKIQSTSDGGGTWAATSADPFATVNEHIDFPVLRLLTKTQFRLIVGRITTDAGNAAEIAYADVTFGAEATTVWTQVDVGAVTGEVITAIAWPEFGRLYVATDGADVYLSTDQGVSFAAIATDVGGNINDIYRAPNGNTYFVGTANVILIEKGNSGTLEVLVGPTGSDSSAAVAVANDGVLWLGNGTSIFRSLASLPTLAGNWTSSKDFGTNHLVRKISLKGADRALGGDSQVMHVVANDTSAPEGDAWVTLDGGGFWEEITNLTNVGYNGAYFSPLDDNLGWIVGEIQTTATIHKLSPKGGV